MSANSVAILQSETPNLDLPPTQFRADDDDDLISLMLMGSRSPGAQEQAPVTGSQEAPL